MLLVYNPQVTEKRAMEKEQQIRYLQESRMQKPALAAIP
jgi:hypothetical protein